jgi:hypothetical protein
MIKMDYVRFEPTTSAPTFLGRSLYLGRRNERIGILNPAYQ